MVVLLMLALIAADQYTKYMALTHLKPVGTVPIIDGVFNLTFVENTGAAFGILQGARLFFIIITPIILVCMLLYYKRLPKSKPYNYMRLCLLMVASGAIGNFVDRLIRGYVIDFFHFSLINFPVFNVADCFVCIGAIVIVYITLFIIKE